MGNSPSYPGLSQDVLEDYTSLTYLSKGEIMYLMKKFYSINPLKLEADPNYRFQKNDIMEKFPAIKNNPFSDRIFRVFSSKRDDCFSFEDLLDFCSVMRSDCPIDVKAEWAFRIFDIDEDQQISQRDICEILERLTTTRDDNRERILDQTSKEHVAKVIIKEMNLDSSGSISLNEFKLIVTRIPEFATAFYLRF